MEVDKIEEMRRSFKTIIFNCPTSLGLNNNCGAGMKCFDCWGKALGVLEPVIESEEEIQGEDV